MTTSASADGGEQHGFALPGISAGAVLIPFSVLGLVASRVVPKVLARTSARVAYAGAAVIVTLVAGVFAVGTGSVLAVLAAMAVLGAGVGGGSALMPQLVLTGVPRDETASVLSINQIVGTIGFAMGSALVGLLLAAATPPGALVPEQGGYVLAAVCTVPLLLASKIPLLTRWKEQA